MAAQTSKGEFTGVFTLRTPAEAQKLSDAVRGVIDKSVNIFFTVATQPDAAASLIEDVETTIRLCAEFPELCSMDNTRAASDEALRKLATCSAPILTLLRTHKPMTPMGQEDSEQLASELKKFLVVIARISDLMEDEQINRLIGFTTQCFQHVLILKQTRSDFRLENKLQDANEAWSLLSEQIDKRADVTEDPAIAGRLRSAITQIRTYVPHVISATKQVAVAPQSGDAVAAQEAALFEVASGFQQLLAALKEGKVSGKASFEYDSIAESLDALRDAVKAGSAQAAVDSAAEIARELAALKQKAQDEADAEARRKLEESLAGLHDMTARLIGATKDALADPSKAGALGGIIDQMKEEVVECSLVNKKKNSSLRNRLVQCAAQLSTGIDQLADKTR